MGTAFGKIISSIVNDILMPLIGLLLGGLDFSGLSIHIKDATIRYGAFIQSLIDFLIIAACLFVMIKVFARLTRKKEEATEEIAEEAAKAEETKPDKSDEVVLLEEIRDLLKK